ncbi:TasA family protein [Salsuginibacillus kocurii]|uniref:TasA family protein n=1 Tax=Salsuginibacillus kocurii TaxID=427078 RepID=UPI0003721B58|nr:TasA family protein [Salsuginibacillus kocurii]
MNKTKKVMVATALTGVLGVGAFFGTYSWFTDATATGESEVTAGTLEITDIANENVFLPEGEEFHIAPSRTVEGETITVANTGNMEVVPRLKLNMDVNGDDNNDNYNGEDLRDKYEVTMHFEREDRGYDETRTLALSDVDEDRGIINQFFPEEDGFEYPVAPGDDFEVTFDLKLKEEAGNEYQGSVVTGSLEVEAKQTDEGAEYENE